MNLSFLSNFNYSGTLYADDLSDMRPFDVAVDSLPPANDELCVIMEETHTRPSLHGHNLHLIRIEEQSLRSDETMKVPLAANGGFVLHIRRYAHGKVSLKQSEPFIVCNPSCL
ncbi:hypothetical protein FACS1894184_06190 [Clostridia bacterium]|nr:hypothetical protein FACS1894184_06190 [Clostridia bacterium]